MTSFDEALAEFRLRASIDDLVTLARFTDKTPATALGWLTDTPDIKGEILVKLQHFFSLAGWEIDELEQLPTPAFKLGQLIALRLVSVDEVVKRLSYTKPSGLYLVLQGSGIHTDRIAVMERIVDELENQRAEAIANFVSPQFVQNTGVRTHRAVIVPEAPQPPAETMAATVVASPEASMPPGVIAALLSNSLASTAMLFDEAAGKGADLTQVRAMVGTGRILALNEHLFGMLD